MCPVRAYCCRHTWLVRSARTAWVPLSRASQAPSLRRVWPQPLAAVRKLRRVETGAPAADPRARPIPCMHFDAAPKLLPGVLMVWDFCHRYRCKQGFGCSCRGTSPAAYTLGSGSAPAVLVSCVLRGGANWLGAMLRRCCCWLGRRASPPCAGSCCGCRPSRWRGWRRPSWSPPLQGSPSRRASSALPSDASCECQQAPLNRGAACVLDLAVDRVWVVHLAPVHDQ